MVHLGLQTNTIFEQPQDASLTRPPRHTRKLFDKLMVAFHHACDIGDLEISDRLLALLELTTTQREHTDETNRRRNIEGLVAAHERLWHLRHPSIG